jgi:uncharacterized membrane protein YeaQ/YmgE (transglycosylase-associated protein family)
MQGQFLRILYYLILAFAIGTLAQVVTGYKRRPLFTTFLLGFIGVFLGDNIPRIFHVPYIIPPVFGISLFWSILGAVVLILIFRLLRGRW